MPTFCGLHHNKQQKLKDKQGRRRTPQFKEMVEITVRPDPMQLCLQQGVGAASGQHH